MKESFEVKNLRTGEVWIEHKYYIDFFLIREFSLTIKKRKVV